MRAERSLDRSAQGDIAGGPCRLSVRPLPSSKPPGLPRSHEEQLPAAPPAEKKGVRGHRPKPAASAESADSDSDSGTSWSADTRAASVAQLGGCLASAQVGPRHEGWLSKCRLSHDGSVRWHRRYFVLSGCTLSYSSAPGAAQQKSIDIRRVKHVVVSDSEPRELQINIDDSRSWQLRADDLVTARRWSLMLEAGRLVGAFHDMRAQDGAESDSDDSSASTQDSGEEQLAKSTQSAPSTEEELQGDSCQNEAMAVEVQQLDSLVEDWMQVAVPEDGGRRVSSDVMKASLANVLQELQHAISAGENEDAAAVLQTLREYLLQLHRRLQRWVQQGDPTADEVADSAVWMLHELQPSLQASLTTAEQQLQAGGEETDQDAAKEVRKVLTALEHFLLSEWETRSCDELFRRCEAAFAMPADAAADNCAPVQERLCLALEILRLATAGEELFRGHAAACDRSVSVVLSTLNTLLRSYRGVIRVLVAPLAGSLDGRRGSVRHTERMVQALRGLRDRTFGREASAMMPSLTDVAYLASEVSALAGSCSKESTSRSALGDSGCCSSVLTVFAGAFEREAAELCAMLAQVHFRSACRQTLQSIAISTPSLSRSLSGRRSSSRSGRSGSISGAHRGQQRDKKPLGSLEAACTAAAGFVEDLLGGDAQAPQLFRELLCTAVTWVLVRRWARSFCRAAPRLAGSAALLNAVAADEASLCQLSKKWAVQDRWGAAGFSNPIKPLMEATVLLGSPVEQIRAKCTQNLQASLGEEQGLAVAQAATRAALQ